MSSETQSHYTDPLHHTLQTSCLSVWDQYLLPQSVQSTPASEWVKAKSWFIKLPVYYITSSSSSSSSINEHLHLLTISPLSVSLLSQSFLSEVFILVFVPLPTEVVLAGLEEKRMMKSYNRWIRIRPRWRVTSCIYVRWVLPLPRPYLEGPESVCFHYRREGELRVTWANTGPVYQKPHDCRTFWPWNVFRRHQEEWAEFRTRLSLEIWSGHAQLTLHVLCICVILCRHGEERVHQWKYGRWKSGFTHESMNIFKLYRINALINAALHFGSWRHFSS